MERSRIYFDDEINVEDDDLVEMEFEMEHEDLWATEEPNWQEFEDDLDESYNEIQISAAPDPILSLILESYNNYT